MPDNGQNERENALAELARTGHRGHEETPAAKVPDTGHRGAEVRAMMREKCTEKGRHNMPDNGRKESRH